MLNIEQKILSVLKSTYNTRFVNIKWGRDLEKIWTISINTESTNTPLVLLHGFAAGIGFWVRNLDALSKDRPVYAMDLLGFGRSSRPEFSTDSLEAEKQLVDSIEAWRKQLKLDQFILLGHSMGGYLATSYAISYPERVKHLILADPWGFGDKAQTPPRTPSWKLKVLGIILYPFTNFNPLASVRAIGPFGPWMIQTLRRDIISNFDDMFEDKTIIPNYIYHCNAQNPTGETAFHHMIQGFGWAKNPMIYRVQNLHKDVPITFLYGAHTWMDKTIPTKVKEMRTGTFFDVQVIEGAGHHIYADQSEQFNEIIVNTCKAVDGGPSIQRISSNKNGIHNSKTLEEIETEILEDQTEIQRN